MEQWKDVLDTGGRFRVSDLGNIIGARGRLMVPQNRRGYPAVRVLGKSRDIHTMVLEAFVCLRPDEMECRHLDGDKWNPSLSNLKWGTRSENQTDRVLHGCSNRGARCGKAILTAEQVVEIRGRVATCRSLRGLAREYGVNDKTIRNIRDMKSWLEA
jgi:hypothetical protein